MLAKKKNGATFKDLNIYLPTNDTIAKVTPNDLDLLWNVENLKFNI